jgi:hypothetical protein
LHWRYASTGSRAGRVALLAMLVATIESVLSVWQCIDCQSDQVIEGGPMVRHGL